MKFLPPLSVLKDALHEYDKVDVYIKSDGVEVKYFALDTKRSIALDDNKGFIYISQDLFNRLNEVIMFEFEDTEYSSAFYPDEEEMIFRKDKNYFLKLNFRKG